MVWIDYDLMDEGVKKLSARFTREGFLVESDERKHEVSYNGISIMTYNPSTIIFYGICLTKLSTEARDKLRAILRAEGLEKVVKKVYPKDI
jgi:hypothetical protein